jgi:spermidine synthase
VIELEPAVVEWAGTHLRRLNRHGVDDHRVRLVVGDLRRQLGRLGCEFDAICLDVDNGPGWLVHEANAELYSDEGLESLAGLLRRPGGRLAVWASAPDPEFERRLRERFALVRTVTVDVARGPADVIYVGSLAS